MGAFGEYHHKAVQHEYAQGRRSVFKMQSKGGKTPSMGQLRERLRLNEEVQEIMQGLNDIIQPAYEFLKQEIADRAELPDDSPEISFLHGLLGIIQQGTPKDADTLDQGMLREKIMIMSDQLEAMVGEDAHGLHGEYATKLVSGLRRYSNRIDPADDDIGDMDPDAEGDMGEPGGDPGEEPAPDEEPAPGEEPAPDEEEEPEEGEADKLARELGVG